MIKKKPDWLKSKGYMHITPSLSLENDWKAYEQKITNKKYIEKYAFFPLMHDSISERKYKRFDERKHLNTNRSGRTHCFKISKGKSKQTVKSRPIHYASHFDSLIYSYYGNILNSKYLDIIKKDIELDKCIIAYRKIDLENETRGKSTIHFAKEAFDEIENRSQYKNVAALTFDIENFFSGLDHKILYGKWCEIINKNYLPEDHYKVFRACTNFRYILRDNLRVKNTPGFRRTGFDEKKLHLIRKAKGYKCFYHDINELREEIKNGRLKIYKNPFSKKLKNGKIVKIGIPQGLPLSAVLANIYLLDFDRNIIKEVVRKYGGYYRRYSDDLLIICDSHQVDNIKQFVLSEILKYGLNISSHKTEEFLFENLVYNKNSDKRLTSVKIENNQRRISKPLIYLGFEYRGFNTSIKSTNLSKYFRRLIYIVKRRAKRAGLNITPESRRAIYKHQVKKLYNAPLKNIDSESKDLKQKFRTRYKFVKNEMGEYDLEPVKMPIKHQSNYISYLKRCDKIFNRDASSSFLKQIRKRHNILNHAIKKNLNKNFN